MYYPYTIVYTLHQKKDTLPSSIFPGDPGSLTLTYGWPLIFQLGFLQALPRSTINFENDPMLLTLTLGHQEKLTKKR